MAAIEPSTRNGISGLLRYARCQRGTSLGCLEEFAMVGASDVLS